MVLGRGTDLRRAARASRRPLTLVVEELGVDRGELLPLRRARRPRRRSPSRGRPARRRRSRRTRRDGCRASGALVDAVDGAFVDAASVLHVDAGLCDRVGHAIYPFSTVPTLRTAVYRRSAARQAVTGARARRTAIEARGLPGGEGRIDHGRSAPASPIGVEPFARRRPRSPPEADRDPPTRGRGDGSAPAHRLELARVRRIRGVLGRGRPGAPHPHDRRTTART